MEILIPDRVRAKCETWPSLQQLACACVHLHPNWKTFVLAKRIQLVEYYMQHPAIMAEILGPVYFKSTTIAATRQNAMKYIQKAGHPVQFITVALWSRFDAIKDAAKLIGVV